MQFQCLGVGVHGGFQFIAARQGVATVVVVACAFAIGKAFSGRGVIAGLVERLALPARILEPLRGFRRLLRFQQALPLLIGTQPEVIETEGVAVLRQAQQQQW